MQFVSLIKSTCVFMVTMTSVCAFSNPSKPICSLTLIPPSPVSDKITLDIRGAVWNRTDSPKNYDVKVYLDNEDTDSTLYQEKLSVQGRETKGVQFRWPTNRHAGEHQVILTATSDGVTNRKTMPLTILDRPERTTGTIDGAWFEFYHWSEREGRLWNKEIKTLTDPQWKELITGMHNIGFNLVIVQDDFYNPNRYVGKHTMEKDGYTGKAYYPSKLFSKLETIAASDPLEAILVQADKYGMYVMVGVGNYAWFDFTEGSLEWHKKIADELWEMYGHHPSFYGWYISEEIAGNLGTDNIRREEIVHFFKNFKNHVYQLAPDKPVMLATNCHGIAQSNDYYPKLLQYLDIICPFGFHRMPEGDYSGEEAASILQKYCDDAQAHLWMDMEVFLFGQQQALYPRPISGITNDLKRFPNFEKILCYAYTGLMNAPEQTKHPGGPATVDLYRDYQKYLKHGEQAFLVNHAARGKAVALTPSPDQRYQKGNLTDGILGGADYLSEAWLGFQNTDVEILLTLDKPVLLKEIAVNCLQFNTGGIRIPKSVTFEISLDKKNFVPLGTISSKKVANNQEAFCHLFTQSGKNMQARYIRIKLQKNAEWLFIDEVLVNPEADHD